MLRARCFVLGARALLCGRKLRCPWLICVDGSAYLCRAAHGFLRFLAGTAPALPGAWLDGKSVEEIDAYLLAVDLRDDIGRLTDSGAAAKNFKFRDQIRDSAASVTKNLSEGFDRYYHGEFAYFAGVAKGSLGETIDVLKEGQAKQYFSSEDFNRLLALAEKARKATSGLIRYLRSSEAPDENRQGKGRRRRH